MKTAVFQRQWQWEMSRNMQIWHSELNCHISYIRPGYKHFGLPVFYQLRLHRGTHCDFIIP